MTPFEHAMTGASLALALGTQRRHGWGIVLTAATAAALPDLDGLGILFSPSAYETAHRVWGHNLLVAGAGGAVVGAIGYVCQRSTRVRTWVQARWRLPSTAPPPSGFIPMLTWLAVGALAGLSHLATDLVFSGTTSSSWPIALFWPLASQRYAVPIVPWGDLGATLIFIATMFALYRWRGREQLIASAALVAVTAYVALRWLVAG